MSQRARQCDNPEPMYGGNECYGNNTKSMECNVFNCPGKH